MFDTTPTPSGPESEGKMVDSSITVPKWRRITLYVLAALPRLGDLDRLPASPHQAEAVVHRSQRMASQPRPWAAAQRVASTSL